MAGKLIITRGLSGSGKTAWAKDYCSYAPGDRVRCNRDDIRAMLHGGYLEGHERQEDITAIQHGAVRTLLQRGKTVVVDDTNLALKHARAFAKLAYEKDARFEVNSGFLAVPLETCVRRDAERDVLHRVGEKVIRGQHKRYFPMVLKTFVTAYVPPAGLEIEPYAGNPGLPNAIIVDVDGTLARNLAGRDYYDYTRVSEDTVNKPIADLVYLQSTQCGPGDDTQVIVVSGREDSCYDDTARWLNRDAGYDELYMRPAGDGRPDTEIKLEIFNNHIRGRFNVLYVLDDRDAVVAMWRKLGLTCLQVAPGKF